MKTNRRKKADEIDQNKNDQEKKPNNPEPVDEALQQLNSEMREVIVESLPVIEKAEKATDIAREFDKSVKKKEKEIERTYETYVSFRVGREEYALKIFSVKEILKNEEITFIPHAPTNILGIIQLRGKVIPIIDLRKRLGISGGDYGDTSKIIICLLDNQLIGIKVDSVSRVLKIYDDQLEVPPEKILHEKKNTVRYVAHFEKAVVIILDESKINLIEFKD